MSLIVTFNGSNYIIPQTGEVGWGSNLDSYLVAIAAGCLQKTGGNFTLSADVDFGASFGLKSLYYQSRGSNIASSGVLRLNNNSDTISWRNAANSGDLPLLVNASNQLVFNGIVIGGASLYTANRAIISDGSGNLAASITTSTEIGYVSGVTSSIQTQLNGKQPTITVLPIANGGTNSSTTLNNNRIVQSFGGAIVEAAAITASRAIVSDTNGIPTQSVTTTTELSYVSGVTSAIQTQLNTKIDTAGTALSKSGTTLNVSTVPVANGGTNATSFTAYSIICAGTTSTGTFQNVSGVGSSGQVLTSNGAAALPTWQNVAGSGTVNSGTIYQLAYYAASTNVVSGNANIVTDVGGHLNILPSSNQIVLAGTGGANTVTINGTSPISGSFVATIPSISQSCSFVMTDSGITQTLAGTYTFTNAPTITNAGTTTTEVATIGQVNNAFAMDNILINGGFDFWQRGISFTTPGSGSYVIDRWNIQKSGTVGSYNVNQDTSQLDGSGTYECNIATGGSLTSSPRVYIQQRVENYADYKGKTITLRVRLLASTADTHITAQIDDGVGTTNSVGYAGNNTFDTLTVTRTISSSATHLYINIGWVSADVTALNLYITSAMLVLGSVAVPYQARPYAQELVLCQRYYEKSYSINVVPGTNTAVGRLRGNSSQFGTTSVRSCYIPFKVTKQNENGSTTVWTDAGTSGSLTWTSTSGTDTDRVTSTDTRLGGFSVSQTAALDFIWAGHFAYEAEI